MIKQYTVNGGPNQDSNPPRNFHIISMLLPRPSSLCRRSNLYAYAHEESSSREVSDQGEGANWDPSCVLPKTNPRSRCGTTKLSQKRTQPNPNRTHLPKEVNTRTTPARCASPRRLQKCGVSQYARNEPVFVARQSVTPLCAHTRGRCSRSECTFRQVLRSACGSCDLTECLKCQRLTQTSARRTSSDCNQSASATPRRC